MKRRPQEEEGKGADHFAKYGRRSDRFFVYAGNRSVKKLFKEVQAWRIRLKK
jgi:hypothetical protein